MDLGDWLAALTALLVGLLTIYSMTKIWGEAFWKPHPEGASALEGSPIPWSVWVAVGGLAILTIIIGLFPAPFYQFAQMSADQLIDPSTYIRAVLGVEAP